MGTDKVPSLSQSILVLYPRQGGSHSWVLMAGGAGGVMTNDEAINGGRSLSNHFSVPHAVSIHGELQFQSTESSAS